MTSDNQEKIRNLFNLKRDEKIIDDFGCSLSETIPIRGRLYLTDKHICFCSRIFFFNRKYTISFSEIIELKLLKSNLQIKSKKNKNSNFRFTSFKDIRIAYKRIKLICRSYNENLSKKDKEKQENIPILLSESEDSDDEDDEIVTNASSSSAKENSIDSNSSDENYTKRNTKNNFIENNLDNQINTNSNQNLINLSSSNINIKPGLIESHIKEDFNISQNSNKEDINIKLKNFNNSNVTREKSANSNNTINNG